jgi:hypothetical protein
MPILEAEEYEEIVKEKNGKHPPAEFRAGDGEALVLFNAYASRDTLSNVADAIGLDEDAWAKFKWAEEFEIEAIVDIESGEIVKARLT